MEKEKKLGKSEKTVEFVIEDPDLQPGKTDEMAVTDEPLGRYEIIEELAHGGSGKILAVFDRHIGRKIAMKELISDSIKPPAPRIFSLILLTDSSYPRVCMLKFAV